LERRAIGNSLAPRRRDRGLAGMLEQGPGEPQCGDLPLFLWE
jgi:hypothetical protein